MDDILKSKKFLKRVSYFAGIVTILALIKILVIEAKLTPVTTGALCGLVISTIGFALLSKYAQRP